MRDYAKVSPAFWTRGSGKRLRGNIHAQLLGLYVVTCPNANMLGIYYLPEPTIAHETGLTIEQIRIAFEVLTEADFAHYDTQAEMVWVPNMATYQIGSELKEHDKRRLGIRAELAKVGNHWFVQMFLDRYAAGYGVAPSDSIHSHSNRVQAPSEGLASPIEGHTADQGRAGEEQEKSRSKGASARGTALTLKALDPNWKLDDALRGIAAECAIQDVEHVFQKFKATHQSKATVRADWTAAWRAWCADEAKYQKRDRMRKAPVDPLKPPSHQAWSGRHE